MLLQELPRYELTELTKIKCVMSAKLSDFTSLSWSSQTSYCNVQKTIGVSDLRPLTDTGARKQEEAPRCRGTVSFGTAIQRHVFTDHVR
jgi:hypothetical protein